MNDNADDAAGYGEGCAAFYDEIYPPPSQQALRLLQGLANGGRVLEAGIGTGRYALPLLAQGLAVHGIEASPAMRQELRRKPGGTAIGMTEGDFSRVSAPGQFALVLCLTDTLALLPDHASQQAALIRLAASVAPEGRLLLETCHAAGDSVEEISIDLNTLGGKRNYCVRLLRADLALLDAVAQASGLGLVARWRNWQACDWNGEAGMVLSLYARVPG